MILIILAFLHNKSNKTLAKKEMTRIAEANTGHFPKQISIYSTVLMQSKQITAYQGKSKDILIPSCMCTHSYKQIPQWSQQESGQLLKYA